MIAIGAGAGAALLIAALLLSLPPLWLRAGEIIAAATFLAGGGSYLLRRPTAREAIWPRAAG